MHLTQRIRRGITLVELLVVISILAVLASIVAVFAPRMMDHARVPDAARQLQSWLQVSRQRAVRDQAPRGIRLLNPDRINEPDAYRLDGNPCPTSQNPDQILYHRLVYVEQPEDIVGVPNEIQPATALPTTPAAFSAYSSSLNTVRQQFQTAAAQAIRNAITADATLTASLTPYVNAIDPAMAGGNPTGWRFLLWLQGRNLNGVVHAGDVIEFAGARYSLMIDPLPYSTADSILVLHRQRDEYRDFNFNAAANQLVRNTLMGPPTALPPYRISRSPQPIAGEPELELQRDVAIDVFYVSAGKSETRSLPALSASAPSGSGNFDIMFAPSGEMTGNLATAGKVVLWIRDTGLGDSARNEIPPGDNRLIVVHCRTGQVTAHPVSSELNASGTLDLYKYVRDGRSSAME